MNPSSQAHEVFRMIGDDDRIYSGVLHCRYIQPRIWLVRLSRRSTVLKISYVKVYDEINIQGFWQIVLGLTI